MDHAIGDLLRSEAPQVLGALVRRYGRFDAAEDAVQEALLAAARQWPERGIPDSPRGWLITVAARALTRELRRDQARRRREDRHARRLAVADASTTAAADTAAGSDADDSLTLLFMCCHPSLTPASQMALTLRAVGGLTTEEIAAAFLVPSSTIGQRISRAKRTIADSGVPFTVPGGSDFQAGLAVVCHVLYLVFNEGYLASSGTDLVRVDLTREAIRLARLLRSQVASDGEVAGLLALMLLIDARRDARVSADGAAVALADQDRGRWDRDRIREGTELVTWAMGHTAIGPYQVQAAIAALHAEAPTFDDTDWAQILELYGLLEVLTPTPMVRLNRAVAVAMVHGPHEGLAELERVAHHDDLAGHHRAMSVRAHLLERAGERTAALTEFRRAARLATNEPERRAIQHHIGRLAEHQAPTEPAAPVGPSPCDP